jgi:hypothetical protein
MPHQIAKKKGKKAPGRGSYPNSKMGRYMSFVNSKRKQRVGMFISEVLKAKCGLRTHPKPIVESQNTTRVYHG